MLVLPAVQAQAIEQIAQHAGHHESQRDRQPPTDRRFMDEQPIEDPNAATTLSPRTPATFPMPMPQSAPVVEIRVEPEAHDRRRATANPSCRPDPWLMRVPPDELPIDGTPPIWSISPGQTDTATIARKTTYRRRGTDAAVGIMPFQLRYDRGFCVGFAESSRRTGQSQVARQNHRLLLLLALDSCLLTQLVRLE